jgi:hypothetical protein
VARTHSRPHVSNDNPFSEAVNKTIKCAFRRSRPPVPVETGHPFRLIPAGVGVA